MNILKKVGDAEMLVKGIFISADNTGLENTKKLKGVNIVATMRMQLHYSLITGTDDQNTKMYQT